ncbi:MAG: L,D-transpeptidase family protein [Pirellulales bacterium]
MNTLKPLLICAVLAGIGYGVYVRINSGNDLPPPGAPQDWNAPPEVQLGDLGQPSALPGVPSGAAGAAPPWPGTNSAAASSAAPPFAAAPPTPQSADTAAPFAPPVVHGTNPAADSGASAGPIDQAAAAPPTGGDPFPPSNDASDPYAQTAPGDPAAALADPNQVPVAGVPDRYQSPAAAPTDRYATPEANVVDRYQPPEAMTPNADATGAADRYGAPQGATPDAYPPQDPNAAGQYGVPSQGSEPQPTQPDGTFVEVLESARQELEVGQMASALEKLSSWYNDPRLAPAEQQQLNQLLDQVAGTVVYSTQHLLEPPYEVQPSERLEDIAQRYSVPWQLLAKINGIDDPGTLRPGERIKVVRGPFNAVVDLERRELTLVLANGCYAGRFPIGIGQDQPPREGRFAVSDKVVDPVYHGRTKVVGAGDQENPYGNRWIGLGTDLAIHGTDRAENVGRTDLPGSISLRPQDAQDVFDILAAGSQVTIRR